jgi:hypothetical protein
MENRVTPGKRNNVRRIESNRGELLAAICSYGRPESHAAADHAAAAETACASIPIRALQTGIVADLIDLARELAELMSFNRAGELPERADKLLSRIDHRDPRIVEN